MSPLDTLIQTLIVTLLVAIVGYLQHRYRFLQYAFFLRAPIALALAILLLPLAVYSRAFGNLFVLTREELGVVAFMLIVSSLAVVYSVGLIFVGAAPRFRLRARQPDENQEACWDERPRANKLGGLFDLTLRRSYLVLLALSLPILVVSFRSSTEAMGWDKAVAIALGIGAAIGARELAIWVGRSLRRWFYAPQRSVPSSQVFKLRRRIRQAGYRISDTRIGRVVAAPFLSGFSNLSSDDPRSTSIPGEETESTFSHWRAACFAVLALIIYAIGGYVLSPDRTNIFVLYTPALAYVLLVLMLAALVVPAATFVLDFYRVPLLALFVVFVAVSYRYSDLDHYYVFEKKAVGAPLPAPDVVKAWAATHQPDAYPVMVVIAASGGGSHAARWTTEVLRQLSVTPGVGQPFFESTTLMSIVSGGSLGSMYAWESFGTEPKPNISGLAAATEAASHSNVKALAWGLTYPDLVRKIFPWTFEDRDRGWALEQSWKSVLAHGDRVPTLDEWTTATREGHRPALIFNATSRETGRRLLISQVVIPESTAHQFALLYPDRDLSVITAVRLSAAFPYLSPMARPTSPFQPTDPKSKDFENIAFHLGDGGYYDSSGVLTTVEFLKSVLPQYRALGRRKILFVQIRTALEDEPGQGNIGWLPGLAGPPMTAIKVSQSSQANRAEQEVALLAERWNNESLPDDARVIIQPVVFRLKDTGTLPWHLSTAEKISISNAWMAPENQRARRTVVDFLASP